MAYSLNDLGMGYKKIIPTKYFAQKIKYLLKVNQLKTVIKK